MPPHGTPSQNPGQGFGHIASCAAIPISVEYSVAIGGRVFEHRAFALASGERTAPRSAGWQEGASRRPSQADRSVQYSSNE
jgi:hypothetical protein